MTSAPALPPVVDAGELEVGELLAEGGEGRVYLLPRLPHLVFKAYRNQVARAYLDELVAWPDRLGQDEARSVLAAAAAWPTSVVLERSGRPAGLLMPRAPRRFAVRHRDGNSRLASLSYLTADPGHRAVAYGIDLPPAASADRVGLVYALARLLDVFASSEPPVAHGDLSTKNVLWSLTRGPEIFVIDCDSSEIVGSTSGTRRRAMTPNWNDPAVSSGANPTAESDRYSLALIFLRIVGAANFPIQARQRTAGSISVEVALPAGPGSSALLDPDANIWRLCEAGLRTDNPLGRPSPAAWAEELERLLVGMGARTVVESVASAQGTSAPSGRPRRSAHRPEPTFTPVPEDSPNRVRIVPVVAARRSEQRWTRIHAVPARSPRPSVTPSAPAVGGLRTYGGPVVGAAPRSADADRQPIWPEALANARRASAYWARKHAGAVTDLSRSGTRVAAVRTLAFCAVVDLVALFLAVFFFGILLAPFAGL